MAAYLLDTHVLIWLITEPDKMSRVSLGLLSEAEDVRLVSAVSAYEISQKFALGKLPGADVMLHNWKFAISELLGTETPLTITQGLRAGSLAWAHRDPFDRLLAAQAIELNVPLISKDPVMKTCPQLEVIW